MDAAEPFRLETEALIDAIWGPRPAEPPPVVDAAVRDRQNQALAAAMRAYLQQYLAEL